MPPYRSPRRQPLIADPVQGTTSRVAERTTTAIIPSAGVVSDPVPVPARAGRRRQPHATIAEIIEGGLPARGGTPPGWQPSRSPQQQAKGFFGALFDFGFNSFVTPSLVKMIYVAFTVLAAIYYVFAVIGALASGEPILGLAVLLLGWIPALLLIAFMRVTLEFYYAVIRMSEDVHQRRSGQDL